MAKKMIDNHETVERLKKFSPIALLN